MKARSSFSPKWLKMVALCTIFLLCFTTFVTPSTASAPKMTKEEYQMWSQNTAEEFFANYTNPEWFSENVTIDEYGQMLFEKNGKSMYFSFDSGVMIIPAD